MNCIAMDSAQRFPGRNGRRKQCCNSQTCLAYLLSLVASAIIVHGFYRCYKERNTRWLILPCLGVILIFIGSGLYRCGAINLHRANYGRRKRTASKRATIGSQLFESQLSLNMLPQCFSNFDTYTGSSRILSANNHRYLSLPIDSPSTSTGARAGHSISEVHLQNLITTREAINLAKSNSNLNGTLLEGQQTSLAVDRSDSISDERSHNACNTASENDTLPSDQSQTEIVAGNEGDAFEEAEQIGPLSSHASTENVSIALSSDRNDLVHHVALSAENISTTTSIECPESLIEFDEGNSVAEEVAPMNEAPPSYEEVIDFDSSVVLVSHYRTL